MTLQHDKAYGCLLGLVLADALGSHLESMEQSHLRSRLKNKAVALEYAIGRDSLAYTDDGQMALAVAEHLAEHATIVSDDLMRRFADVYESWRGYGQGARAVIDAYRDNAEYEFMVENLFPGGSFGNGAAMRSAPVGLRFLGDMKKIWQEAKNSAWPTHRHPLGIEGAQIMAAATSFAVIESQINPTTLAEYLLPLCSTVEFKMKLSQLSEVKTDAEVEQLGNGIEAHESVVTALACFALYPDDYQQAISTALWQGGDTDTIAAMAGALVGAHVGMSFADGMPISRLEHGERFLAYVSELARRLA